MLSDDIKQELVQGLTEIFQWNMSAIILYGSVARGDETDESDIDIAIVIKKRWTVGQKSVLLVGRQT